MVAAGDGVEVRNADWPIKYPAPTATTNTAITRTTIRV
jgi:hypothetical protein